MIISGILAIIATTATVFGLVNTGANVAGAVHDKAMINESLQNMQQTQQLLQQKANAATGANKQEMLIAASKLKQVNTRMKELNNEAYTSALRNEAAGLAKGLVASAGGVGKLGDVVANSVGIGETAADQVIGNKGLSNTLGNAQMDRWQTATKAGDNLDVQILIMQARELAKKTKALDGDMQKMKEWFDNEKPGNTDTAQVDQIAVDLIANDPTLPIEPILSTDLPDAVEPAKADDPDTVVSDPKSGVGLDFLNFNGYGKTVEMNYDIADMGDPINSSRDEYSQKVINRHWDQWARESSNMDIKMKINKDNTVTGTMKGIAVIISGGQSNREVDFVLNGKFDPASKTFEGRISGDMIAVYDGGYSGDFETTSKFVSSLKNIENLPNKDQYFTFKGSVDESTGTIDGYFCFLHWREMWGEY